MIGATIFYISGFTALPGINNKLSSAALDGAYWFPQILGAIFFVISGLLFMIETQKRWWLPAPRVLGWHIGKQCPVRRHLILGTDRIPQASGISLEVSSIERLLYNERMRYLRHHDFR